MTGSRAKHAKKGRAKSLEIRGGAAAASGSGVECDSLLKTTLSSIEKEWQQNIPNSGISLESCLSEKLEFRGRAISKLRKAELVELVQFTQSAGCLLLRRLTHPGQEAPGSGPSSMDLRRLQTESPDSANTSDIQETVSGQGSSRLTPAPVLDMPQPERPVCGAHHTEDLQKRTDSQLSKSLAPFPGPEAVHQSQDTDDQAHGGGDGSKSTADIQNISEAAKLDKVNESQNVCDPDRQQASSEPGNSESDTIFLDVMLESDKRREAGLQRRNDLWAKRRKWYKQNLGYFHNRKMHLIDGLYLPASLTADQKEAVLQILERYCLFFMDVDRYFKQYRQSAYKVVCMALQELEKLEDYFMLGRS